MMHQGVHVCVRVHAHAAVGKWVKDVDIDHKIHCWVNETVFIDPKSPGG